jgi:hypothetical protein
MVCGREPWPFSDVELDFLDVIAHGERIPDGLSVAQLTELRRRVAS